MTTDRRYLKYRNQKFKDWKNKVKKRVPELLRYFAENNDNYDYMKLLGSTIKALYDPLYSYSYEGKMLDTTNQLAFQIMLEIDVDQLFKIVNSPK